MSSGFIPASLIASSVTYKPFFVFKQKFDIVGVQHKILRKSGDNVANLLGKEFFYNDKLNIPNTINNKVYIGYGLERLQSGIHILYAICSGVWFN
jgi:hypothetical protein